MDRMERISTFLDGEMSEADTAAFEAEMASDENLAAEVSALADQDAALTEALDALRDLPVPEALAAGVSEPSSGSSGFAIPAPANSPLAPWASFSGIAAALALLLIGGGGGALLTRQATPEPQIVEVQRGWMAEIADYQRVYARQDRHLVEVPATEADHIETWLSAQTGVPVAIPDLTASGFTFEGARLLVAVGRPVAQLIYRDAEGAVIALCALQSELSGEGFETRAFGADVAMVRWFEPGAAWVVVGEPDAPLAEIARVAEVQI